MRITQDVMRVLVGFDLIFCKDEKDRFLQVNFRPRRPLSMYLASKEIKQDPERRWAQKDRAFFGRGACGILAGAYLKMFPNLNVWAEMIEPLAGMGGNHIFVTNGEIAFDYHGYCLRQSLLNNHRKGWRSLRGKQWNYSTSRIDFDLLSTKEMNANKMLGPDQYLHDPVQRAVAFIRAKSKDCSAV